MRDFQNFGSWFEERERSAPLIRVFLQEECLIDDKYFDQVCRKQISTHPNYLNWMESQVSIPSRTDLREAVVQKTLLFVQAQFPNFVECEENNYDMLSIMEEIEDLDDETISYLSPSMNLFFKTIPEAEDVVL